jgi:MFS family permease
VNILSTQVACAYLMDLTIVLGGLLAAAISNMNGVAGRTGWSWIFILEGLFTILCAIASFWVIQDFPETAKLLTGTERRYSLRFLGWWLCSQSVRGVRYSPTSCRHAIQCWGRTIQDKICLAESAGLEDIHRK